MKIGIDASFLRKPATGIGQVTVGFLETLIERYCSSSTPTTHEIFLYTQEPTDFILPDSCVVKTFLPRFWRRDDVPRQWLWERQVAHEARRDGCEVFLSLAQSATRFSETSFGGGEKSVPRHIMVVHDIIPRLFPQYLAKFSQKRYWGSVERGIGSAAWLIAVSESTKRDLVEHLHIPAERVSVAFPGVAARFRVSPTPEEVARVLARYRLDPGYLYHGGGLEIRKNTESVLRAYGVVREQCAARGEEAPLLVISGQIHASTNPLATPVLELVATLGLEEHVRILGRVPDADLPALYRGAKLFLFPSLYEGFGLPVLEALCMACPVIASNTSSLPEVCADAALLVEPHDVSALATSMLRLMRDPALCETLKAKGTVQANRFSFHSFTEQVWKICFPE